MMVNLENIKKSGDSFLKWSERWLKTDMNYLVRNGFWLTLGQVFSSLSALVLSVAFANFLSPELYGTYKYILAFFGVLAISNLPGMGAAIIKAISQGKDGSFFPAFKEKILWGLIGGGASFLGGIYYLIIGNNLLAIPLLIGSLFLPIMDSLALYNAILGGKRDFKKENKFFIYSQILSTLIILSALILTKNLYVLIFTYLVSWTFLRFIFFKKTLSIYKLNNESDSGAITYGKHLSVMGILTSVAGYLDRILLFHYVGPADVAIYSIAVAPVEQIKGVLKHIYTLALPKFSAKNKVEIDKSIKEKMPKLILALIGIIMIYILLAPFFFKILFPKYIASIFFSQIYSISLIIVAVFLPYTSLEATASTKKLYYFNFFTSLFQIGSLFALAPFYGVMGVVIARIISRFFSLGFTIYLNKD